jgi:hypothetical protein
VPQLPSPRASESILILSSPVLDLIVGTVSIISNTCVLTAYHNIAKDPQNPTRALLRNDWIISQGFERKLGKVCAIGISVSVVVVRTSPRDDWALLQRIDGQVFSSNLILHICPIQHIPDDHTEQLLKVYHCAVDIFNSGMVDAVKAVSIDVRLGFTTQHKVFAQGGFFGESSGGVYLINSNDHETNGKLLAMHVESVNNSRLLDEIKNDSGLTDPLEVLAEASDSCVSAHSSFMQGIIIARFKNLMHFIATDI